MKKEMILLSDYCNKSQIELDFILQLEDEGLIETSTCNEGKYITFSQLSSLELFTRLHYDLSINIEGIDVIQELLQKMHKMEYELNVLRRQLNNESFFMEDFFDEL